MSEFGDIADFDMEKLIRFSDQYAERAQEMQNRFAALVGRATSRDGRVKVAYTTGDGVSELHIDPRAMRMRSAELAETIKTLIREATQDLHRQINELMAETFGEENSPMNLRKSRDALRERVDRASAAYHRALNDSLGELERIRRELEL